MKLDQVEAGTLEQQDVVGFKEFSARQQQCFLLKEQQFDHHLAF